MKKSLVYAVVSSLYAFSAHGIDVSNPALALNPQDAPIFYENSPLSGLRSFLVITAFPGLAKELQAAAEEALQKALGKAGQVSHLQDNDMRGFGAGNILLIQTGAVACWDGNKTELTRLSLCLETGVRMDKTSSSSFPMVWSINTFMQGPITAKVFAQAVQNLVDDFVRNYQYANANQDKKAIFYTY